MSTILKSKKIIIKYGRGITFMPGAVLVIAKMYWNLSVYTLYIGLSFPPNIFQNLQNTPIWKVKPVLNNFNLKHSLYACNLYIDTLYMHAN